MICVIANPKNYVGERSSDMNNRGTSMVILTTVQY